MQNSCGKFLVTVKVAQISDQSVSARTGEHLPSFLLRKIGRPKIGTALKVCRSHGPDVIAALQQQLGLKLEPKTGPIEVLVVDHAEKTPTAN